MNEQVDNMIANTWRERHKQTIEEFLGFLNQRTDVYVLKGGTALMECYGLDRFSEDIDLDGSNKEKVFEIMDQFCKEFNYDFRVAKDTPMVTRFMVDYKGKNQKGPKPLKIEISHRRDNIPEREITKRNGITTYKLNNLALMKANAYSARDKIRDLHDVAYIVNNYSSELNPLVLDGLRSALEQKGIEHIEYVVKTQNDDLIDKEKLIESSLEAFDKLGLLFAPAEKEISIPFQRDKNGQISRDDVSCILDRANSNKNNNKTTSLEQAGNGSLEDVALKRE